MTGHNPSTDQHQRYATPKPMHRDQSKSIDWSPSIHMIGHAVKWLNSEMYTPPTGHNPSTGHHQRYAAPSSNSSGSSDSMLPPPQEKSVRIVITGVVVFVALQVLVAASGTGFFSNVGVVDTIWDVEVRLTQNLFGGHQPAIIRTAVGAENNARNIGRKSIPAELAAETNVQLSETAGTLDHTSPPAVGVYEPGGHRVEWASSSSPLPCNILFIKVPKCASSTSGGVARRIAAHHNVSGVGREDRGGREDRFFTTPEPAVSASHGRMSRGWGAMRKLQMRSFLWTMTRLPVSRCLSFWYYINRDARSEASRKRMLGKVEYMRRKCNNHVFKYLKRRASSDTPESLVGGVYGFIGIVERFDESMVMLSYLLRIPLSDVLYLKSKESTKKGFVRHPALAEEDPGVRSYAASAAFNRSNVLDYRLHAAASAELDRRWRSNYTHTHTQPSSRFLSLSLSRSLSLFLSLTHKQTLSPWPLTPAP